MTTHSTVSKAVRRAMLLAAGATALTGFNAVAEDGVDDEVERIQVTGSRIKQVDIETSSPVTVITAADIKVTGETSVADVLNNASVNSFGSWRGMSGYGAGASATSDVNLRGLGSQATLILLDGRRMPGTSSSSGTVADTSSIPMAIVERIEILRDGASAVYGSDAVAGVINIITKKDFEGVEVTYTGEVPEVDGGESNRASITTGYSSDKGNITFTFEHYDTASVYDADIWSELGASSYSSSPNGKLADGSYYSNSDLCAQTPNTIDGTDGNNVGRCFYSYGEVTKLFGNVNKNTMLSNFNYELADNLELIGRASASLSETNTRYAGTPVSTNQPTMSADNALNPLGEDMKLYMRSAQTGERDTLTENNSIDMLLGLAGYVDVADGLDWEINAQHTRSTTNSFNENLINDNIIQDLIDSGEYDIFNTTGMSYEAWDAMMTDMYTQASHTGVYQGQFNSTQIDGLVSGSIFDNGSVSVAGLVGAEYEMIEFVQTGDPQSAAGIISGGSGGDDVDAERDRTSAYFELQSSLPGNVDISAALRYERYEQSGDIASGHASSTFSNTVPKIGVSWRPIDDLLIRASWGESFRAPNMGEMFAGEALSFERALDTVWCADNTDENYCTASQQHKTLYGGNPDLEAEEGDSLTLGFVWSALDNLSFEMSYFEITYDNKIEVVDVADLIREEQDSGSSEFIVRDANGQIDTIHSQYRNLGGLETSGFDFVTNFNQDTDFGDFSVKVELSHVIEYKTKAKADSDWFDEAGLQDKPQWRGNATLNWAYEDFGAAWATTYIGAQDSGNEEYGVTYLADIPSYFKHNVQFSYNHDWNGSVTVGVNNVFDKQAPTWYDGFSDYRDVNTGLYDVLGRTYFLTINQSF
ncbi:Outer membrane receptor proteins, mostly Fe transport [Ferrimonas sediminum]|uniref:Outer membrane receptor proteins, mostly Fe transport n=1 Tax=Ferrimonas sediminum TaxID=718193 RepID=A0A1G8REF0_9GAMM|nr:TonB-dependent receptor [Ferrimonas sediminum]SDJ15434.1 Outer membrane receptor proteins, mostly Fe transport [Ferrimonas sediminum]